MIRVDGEVGGVIQNSSQVDRGASLEHGCLNVQATDETAAAERLVPAGFEQESLSQRLGLGCLADPNELEDKTGCDRIPLFADEREIDLVPQGSQVIGVTVGDRRKVDKREFLGAIERVWGHCSDFPKDEFPDFLGNV